MSRSLFSVPVLSGSEVVSTFASRWARSSAARLGACANTGTAVQRRRPVNHTGRAKNRGTVRMQTDFPA